MGYADPGAVPPLVELGDLIEERTGVKPGTVGGMFKLNPRVDDIPERYAVDMNGVKVLVAGAVKKGGSGCYCPENALVRTLISHLLLDGDTTLVLDMEAGVEHLSRGTIGAVDRVLVVVEPGSRSVETAVRIKGLADDLGLRQTDAVGNKIRSESDESYLRGALPGWDFAGFLPYDESVIETERSGRPVSDAGPSLGEALNKMVASLEEVATGPTGGSTIP
jgi:CO dehydrogenase maturation factor